MEMEIEAIDPVEAHKWSNTPCGCGNCHLLHAQKNVIVRYDGAIWAFYCAYHHLINRLQSMLEETDDALERAEHLAKEFWDVGSKMRRYVGHKAECALIRAADVGRFESCDCGLSEIDPEKIFLITGE
jgi:hypothetical protein